MEKVLRVMTGNAEVYFRAVQPAPVSSIPLLPISAILGPLSHLIPVQVFARSHPATLLLTRLSRSRSLASPSLTTPPARSTLLLSRSLPSCSLVVWPVLPCGRLLSLPT